MSKIIEFPKQPENWSIHKEMDQIKEAIKLKETMMAALLHLLNNLELQAYVSLGDYQNLNTEVMLLRQQYSELKAGLSDSPSQGTEPPKQAEQELPQEPIQLELPYVYTGGS